MPQSCFNCLIKSIKSGEDEIVRFYASKTIENICAQTKTTGSKFASSEVAQLVCNQYSTSKNEGIKTCSASILCHFAHLNQMLVPIIIEKITMKHFYAIFEEGPPKIQQVWELKFYQSSSFLNQFNESKGNLFFFRRS